jgi:hypothetical protein
VLEDAFARADSGSRPVLVDCPIDYRENAELSRDRTEDVRHLMTESR